MRFTDVTFQARCSQQRAHDRGANGRRRSALLVPPPCVSPTSEQAFPWNATESPSRMPLRSRAGQMVRRHVHSKSAACGCGQTA
jgi:hypothetical protein